MTVGFIKIRAVVTEGTVRFYVEDSGAGIPEEKHDKLFTKFQVGDGLGNLCPCLQRHCYLGVLGRVATRNRSWTESLQEII